jgi:hypothetical protein
MQPHHLAALASALRDLIASDEGLREPMPVEVDKDGRLWLANRCVSNLVHELEDGGVAIGARRLRKFRNRPADGVNYDGAAARILTIVEWRLRNETRWKRK